jgi:multidrug resistance protein, MATE family
MHTVVQCLHAALEATKPLTRLAGLLPYGATAVSAIGLAFNIYGTLFMAFVGVAVAVGTRVGNSLGAKRPGSARLSAFTAISVTPLIWLPLAVLLTLPYTQAKLVSFFVRSSDERLQETPSGLLNIVAMLELFDGLQTVMSGALFLFLCWALSSHSPAKAAD